MQIAVSERLLVLAACLDKTHTALWWRLHFVSACYHAQNEFSFGCIKMAGCRADRLPKGNL